MSTPVSKDESPKRFSRKKIVLISIAVLVTLFIATVLFIFFRIEKSVGSTFEGSSLDAVLSDKPLDKDKNDLTNILIFGNSSDDPGHGGALLADSIIVLSVNQKTNKAHTVSIPRDLWIEYGRSCSNGSEGKINAYYQCALKDSDDKKVASRDFADIVGGILGIPIQYYAEVNYTFVKDAVDAVGGVDVNVKSEDPRGILDRNFDSKCPGGPYTCYYVKYDNGPVHLDGIHALYLARARNAKDGYGLPQSNFDREANQQMILQALQEKAFSSDTFTNPTRLFGLLDSLGNNIVTNVPTNQLRSFASTFKSLGSKNISSIPLNKEPNVMVTTGSRDGQSIVLPAGGLYDYEQLRGYITKILSQ